MGRRVEVRLPVRLSTPPDQPRVLPRRGVDAIVTDISVTGMAIDVPDARRLARGAVVHVATDDADGDVLVRHVARAGGRARLGVQFADSHSRLALWAYAQVGEGTDAPGREGGDGARDTPTPGGPRDAL